MELKIKHLDAKNVYLHEILAEGKNNTKTPPKNTTCVTLNVNLQKFSLKNCVYNDQKRCYFLANDIFMALACVILKPCSASRAAPACTSLSNSTKAMSWRPGTRRTSLKPGNLRTHCFQIQYSSNRQI